MLLKGSTVSSELYRVNTTRYGPKSTVYTASKMSNKLWDDFRFITTWENFKAAMKDLLIEQSK